MVSSPSSRTAPQGAISSSQCCGRQRCRQPGIPLSSYLDPITAHRQQQPACHANRLVGNEPKPQVRRRPNQGFQQFRRPIQRTAVQQAPDFPGKDAVQSPRGYHQHWLPGYWVSQGIPRVAEGGEGRHPPGKTHPDWHQCAADTLPGRRPEHHRQHQVSRSGGDQQHFGVHVRIKNAVHHRHAAARQQSQGQHASGHGTGDGKQQQGQPQQPLLSPVGDEGKQHAHNQLYRRFGQKFQPRQKHRHRIGPAQQSRQQVPTPPERNACQPCG